MAYRSGRRGRHACTGELTAEEKARIIAQARAKLLGETIAADGDRPVAVSGDA